MAADTLGGGTHAAVWYKFQPNSGSPLRYLASGYAGRYIQTTAYVSHGWPRRTMYIRYIPWHAGKRRCIKGWCVYGLERRKKGGWLERSALPTLGENGAQHSVMVLGIYGRLLEANARSRPVISLALEGISWETKPSRSLHFVCFIFILCSSMAYDDNFYI